MCNNLSSEFGQKMGTSPSQRQKLDPRAAQGRTFQRPSASIGTTIPSIANRDQNFCHWELYFWDGLGQNHKTAHCRCKVNLISFLLSRPKPTSAKRWRTVHGPLPSAHCEAMAAFDDSPGVESRRLTILLFRSHRPQRSKRQAAPTCST